MWFDRGCATSNLDSFAVWRDFVLPRTPDASVDEVSAACQCCDRYCAHIPLGVYITGYSAHQ